MSVSIGLAGALGPDLVSRAAVAVEASGFDTLWVNDTPDGDALTALAAAARETTRLRLATGVVPVDRRPAADLAAAAGDTGISPDRLTLGIGSGATRRGALELVREAVDILRTPDGPAVVVGALGPRMRRLAAERSDGFVLNWLSPDKAAVQAGELREAAPAARTILYVRTALHPSASARLAAEAARYASFPHYAANFARLGLDVSDTVIDGEEALRARLPEYRAAVDDVVLRAITPDDSPEAYLDFIRRAASALP